MRTSPTRPSRAEEPDAAEGRSRPSSVGSAPGGWRWAGAVASITALVVVFGLVVSHAWIVQYQGEVDGLDGEISELVRGNQRLRLEVAELEAPERIVATAREELGMIEPEPGTVVVLAPLAADEIEASGG